MKKKIILFQPSSSVRSARPIKREKNYFGISYSRQKKAMVKLCGIPPEYAGQSEWRQEEENEEILNLTRPKTLNRNV